MSSVGKFGSEKNKLTSLRLLIPKSGQQIHGPVQVFRCGALLWHQATELPQRLQLEKADRDKKKRKNLILKHFYYSEKNEWVEEWASNLISLNVSQTFTPGNNTEQ